MRGFGFKDNGFFVCTETSPRSYVIQEVSDVNRALDDLNKGSSRGNESNTNTSNNNASDQSSPFLPFLPWWFTSECRTQLLNIQAPSPVRAPTPSTTNGYEPSVTPEPPGGLSPEQLRIRLKRQLEFYFSRENLINDRFLRSQMDSDQYVSIKIVASFPKIIRLTTDFDLIVNVLRESNQVQVDEAGEKVRPVTKRCTIILREIPEDANEEEVKAMFKGCAPYQTLSYAANNSWYVTFANEEDTQKAFMHLQNVGSTFNNKPVYARIKTGGAPIVTDTYQFGVQDKIATNAGTAYKTNVGITPGGETVISGQITIHEVIMPPDGSPNISSQPTSIGTGGNSQMGLNGTGFSLGQILSNYGYVPRASFRPSVNSITTMAAAQQTNSSNTSTALAFTTPTVPITMPMSMISQQPRFLLNRSNVPFVKCSPTDTANNSDKNKENNTFTVKESKNSSSDRQDRPTSSSRSTNQTPHSSSNANTSTTFNNPKTNSNRNNAVNQQQQQPATVNYNAVTPLNKVNTQDPNRTTSTNFYNKDSSYQRNTRDYRASNSQSDRRERPTNSQSGRSNTSRPSNPRNEYRGNYYTSSKSTQRSDNGYNNRDYSYQQQQHSGTQRHSQNDTSSDAEQSNSGQDKNVSYDFVETDFPRLVEKEFKRQNSKQAALPKEERAQFSAVVAGRRAPKVVIEEKRSTYAQTLKRSTNLSSGTSEHTE